MSKQQPIDERTAESMVALGAPPDLGEHTIKAKGERPRRKPAERLPPEHVNPDGSLTREGMLDRIRKGGSVMHGGEIIGHEADLPSEADLARGNVEREKAVRASIDNQIAHLMAERQKVSGEAGTASAQHSDAPHQRPDDDKAERLRRENEELRRQLEGRDQGQKQPDQKQPEPPKSDKGQQPKK